MPGEAELRLCLGDLARSSETRDATDSAVLGGLGVSFRCVSLLDLGENMSFLMMGDFCKFISCFAPVPACYVS